MPASSRGDTPADESLLDPRIERSRAVIVAAATEHFLRHGYLGANVDQIAAEARVSKRTVYNIFGGKEQLFREILADVVDTAERFAGETAETLPDAVDVAAALRMIGIQLARTVLGGQIVRLRRLLIGEAERFPELAGDYYRRAPGRVMDALAHAMHRFHERGLLDVDDARLAAEHFAFLIMGAPLDRSLFTATTDTLTTEEIDAYAGNGVEVFLRAYGRA